MYIVFLYFLIDDFNKKVYELDPFLASYLTKPFSTLSASICIYWSFGDKKNAKSVKKLLNFLKFLMISFTKHCWTGPPCIWKLFFTYLDIFLLHTHFFSKFYVISAVFMTVLPFCLDHQLWWLLYNCYATWKPLRYKADQKSELLQDKVEILYDIYFQIENFIFPGMYKW